MAEHQSDRDLEFIDLFDTDTPDERRVAILAKLRESPEDYQKYEAYLEILDVPVARKKDPPVHVRKELLAEPSNRSYSKDGYKSGLGFLG